MRVLYLNYIPSPYRVDFFNELAKKCELQVVYYNKEITERANWKYKKEEHNYIHHFLFEKEGRWKLSAYFNVYQTLKKRQYDIIVVGGYARKIEMFIIISLYLLGIPFILNTDGGFINHNSIKLILKRFLVKAAHAYLVPGKMAAKTLVYYGAKSNRIYNYRFTSLYESEMLQQVLSKNEKVSLRKKLGIITSKKIAITIGRYIPLKGYELAIKAMHLLDRDDCILIMLGEGESRVNYEKLISDLKLKDKVLLAGNQSKEKVLAFCMAADVMILPTITSDVWGLVVNEAMSCALPVIASDRVGAAHEMVYEGKTGHIVSANNAEEIKKSLEKVFNSPDVYSYQTLKIGKQFSIENMVKDHIDCFNKVLNQTPQTTH